MKVVRQRMIETFKMHIKGIISPLIALAFFSACNPTEITSSGMRDGLTNANGTLTNKAFIYRDSPAIIEGPKYGPKVNIKGSVDFGRAEYITNKNQLRGDCILNLDMGFYSQDFPILDCIHTFASKTPSQTLLNRNPDGSWIFPTGSSEFYQVNGHYHVQEGVNRFFEHLKFAYERLYNPILGVSKSIPGYLPQTGMSWFNAITPTSDNYFRNSFLTTYTLCNFDRNAFYSPAGPEICLGNWKEQPSFFMVQDPSIIYHELGHAFVSIMMNMRNAIPGIMPGLPPTFHAMRSNLGGYGYTEAGSINEGIADYFSFVMNGRTHIGEWGLAKTSNSSRPLSENDALHIKELNTTPEGRLSYPQYLLYDPNEPNKPIEDVHYAGQIVSHYLVALTQELGAKCGLPTASRHKTSTSYVMLLLAETLSELGDLNAVGVDTLGGNAHNPHTFIDRFNNLDEFASYMWTQVVNPPNYRRFFQAFAKNIRKYITQGMCPGYSQNEAEKLLDDYGLLLFKAYKNNHLSSKDKLRQYHVGSNSVINYNLLSPTLPSPPTKVNESNRRKSVLISKQLLDIAETNISNNVYSYTLIEDPGQMQQILENLLFKGYPMNLSKGLAGVEYNNSNVRISPGEVLGVIINLQNKSNSTMAGVHLLANDWDHVDITDTTGNTGNFKPCVVDGVTTVAQGAESGATCTQTLTSYRRLVKDAGTNKYCNKGSGAHCNEAVAPVCLVQLEEGDVTRWVSQNEFRRKQGLSLEPKDCLGYSGTNSEEDFTFNPHECLVRVLPGANRAFFSKIDPQKSYTETIRNGNPKHIFNPGNAIILEVNKWIPPGTKFRCRLRAKFSNCTDCYSESVDSTHSDYIDAEYNGAKPYKIINFEFDVND
jgi:hypothetical protein